MPKPHIYKGKRTVPLLTSAYEQSAESVQTSGNQTINGVKTFIDPPIIPDEAYSAAWNNKFEGTTKNAVYDKIETLGSSNRAFAFFMG